MGVLFEYDLPHLKHSKSGTSPTNPEHCGRLPAGWEPTWSEHFAASGNGGKLQTRPATFETFKNRHFPHSPGTLQTHVGGVRIPKNEHFPARWNRGHFPTRPATFTWNRGLFSAFSFLRTKRKEWARHVETPSVAANAFLNVFKRISLTSISNSSLALWLEITWARNSVFSSKI